MKLKTILAGLPLALAIGGMVICGGAVAQQQPPLSDALKRPEDRKGPNKVVPPPAMTEPAQEPPLSESFKRSPG